MALFSRRCCLAYSTLRGRSVAESNASLLETLSQLIKRPDAGPMEERTGHRTVLGTAQNASKFNVKVPEAGDSRNPDPKSVIFRPGDVSCSCQAQVES